MFLSVFLQGIALLPLGLRLIITVMLSVTRLLILQTPPLQQLIEANIKKTSNKPKAKQPH